MPSDLRSGPVRGLIFDLDGTVIDSHRYTFDAFRYACAPWSDPPTDAQVFAAFGPSERVILARLVPPEHADDAYGRLQHFYARHAGHVAVHPQMRALLADARQTGRRSALFTGRGGDSTALLLAALDLGWAFEAIVAGDEVARPKPAPDGIHRLLQLLELEPGDALVVGDSPLDIAAARAAGTRAIFAAWHAWSGVAAPPGVPVVATPDALRPWLGLGPPGPAGLRDREP